MLPWIDGAIAKEREISVWCVHVVILKFCVRARVGVYLKKN